MTDHGSYMEYKFFYAQSTPAEANKRKAELIHPKDPIYTKSCWLGDEDFKDLAVSLMEQDGSAYPVRTIQHVTADSNQQASPDLNSRTVITVEKHLYLKGVCFRKEVIPDTVADFISHRWADVFHAPILIHQHSSVIAAAGWQLLLRSATGLIWNS